MPQPEMTRWLSATEMALSRLAFAKTLKSIAFLKGSITFEK